MGTAQDTASNLWQVSHWPFVPILTRLGLAVAIGLFIGLEREHSGKNGVRTFALTALLGCLGGLTGDLFSAIALGFVAMAAVWMNLRQMVLQKALALTTSAALTLVGFTGVLCGQRNVFTPILAGVIAATLLAWKQPISGFVGGLTDKELRSAILLAILTLVVFPVLPAHAVDPWPHRTPIELGQRNHDRGHWVC
jgi:MgtC family